MRDLNQFDSDVRHQSLAVFRDVRARKTKRCEDYLRKLRKQADGPDAISAFELGDHLGPARHIHPICAAMSAFGSWRTEQPTARQEKKQRALAAELVAGSGSPA